MTYFYIAEDRINELRKIADSITNSAELNALCMMWGLRQMQEVEEELIQCGEITVDDLYGREECYSRAATYIEDAVSVGDMGSVIDENDLGDYSLAVKPVITVARRI